jgi:hypothetical protein
MNKKLIFITLLFSQISFCQDIVTKNLGDFTGVRVFDKINVKLVRSDENKIEFSGNNNSEVEIVNKNGDLKIRMPFGKLLSGEDISATLYYKQLDNIEASEGSYISSEDTFKQIALFVNAKEGAEIKLKVTVDKITAQIASGAIINLDGSVENQDIVINSGGIYNANQLISEQTSISINAGGSADIFASELVDAKVRAGGTISIYGKPKQINKKTMLGGTIIEVK